MTDRIAEAARATRTRDELLEKVSAAIDETLYAYSHGMMSEAMAKESILTIADEWATDDDEILAHMEMLVRDYGAADDNSLTAGAKVLKRRVLVACAPLMNLTAVLEAIREPSEGMLRASDRFAHTDETENIDWKGIARIQWRAMIDALIAEVRPETMNTMSGRSVGSHLCGVEGSILRPDAPIHEEWQMNKDGPVMPRVPSDDLLRRYTSHKINPVEARAIYSCIRDYLSFREKVEQAQNTSSSQGVRYDQAEDALYLTKVVRSGPEPIESPWAEDE